jgi:pimeloyl-ACP methyl ester carboxylesterase
MSGSKVTKVIYGCPGLSLPPDRPGGGTMSRGDVVSFPRLYRRILRVRAQDRDVVGPVVRAVRRAVQVLVHGAVYSHVYWDFPYQPEKYSYVRRANAAGYATLNIDRIGIRNSSHPPAASVTLQSNAAVVHQAITALRAGALGTTFEKVVTVGHSYGTLTTMLEAEVYDDIDAFMPTGILHPLTQKARSSFSRTCAPHSSKGRGSPATPPAT